MSLVLHTLQSLHSLGIPKRYIAILRQGDHLKLCVVEIQTFDFIGMSVVNAFKCKSVSLDHADLPADTSEG